MFGSLLAGKDSIAYFSVWYCTNCVILKSICASLNVKLCEKETSVGVGRKEGDVERDEGREKEGSVGGKGTPCVSLNFH